MSDGVIDERVVEMRFDNADFERNVNQSIKTIDKLKESLDFENAGESFENISAAASKCDMKPLEQSLEGITVKFNMLEMVAANVLGNITNKIVDAGAKLAKSLTVDQLTAGWSKYDQKTAAVQTIMSATGASIDVVNQKLEKLIWYADETSYDFVDMVNNIGKFTSAGVDLDTAVDSMMGISNWAAASGAGIQQASRAMYNLSQAIGMGYVGLTDWRSIELANMATKEFKETVIATAVELGTLQQAADGTIKTLDGKDIVTAENMRGSLKKGWFDTDVLNTALARYNEFANIVHERQEQWAEEHDGAYITVSRTIKLLESEGVAMDTLGAKAFMRAQEATKFSEAVAATADAVSSGWMRTFEIIFGNYEQAKKLWTDLANDMYDVFASGGERRNDDLSDLMQSNYQKMLNEMPDADEMNYRLYEKLYDITKSNLGMDYADQLFSSFENIEDLLKAYANNISESSLSDAMNSISEDFRKEADTALELSKQLKNGSFTLKQAVLRLVYGEYGKEIEDQKKAVEDLGFNYEMLAELAEQYKVGLTIPWDEYQKQLVESLDEQYDYYNGFVDSIKKLVPTEGFFRGLTELGGRDKLISSLQSIVDTFKNLYLTFVEIGNGVSDLMGSGSFLEKLIDGFYFLTSVIRLSDETFETWQEGISDFFNGGIQKKWKEFWHGFEVRNPLGENRRPGEDFAEDMQHIPGVLDYISAVYKDHLANLPEDVRNTVEKVKTEIFTFFGSIPQKINDLKTKIFGTFDVTPKLNLLTGKVEDVVVHTGGLLNNLKDRIRGLGNGLGGKIFDGILNTIKNIADFLFGYKAEDGTPIEGAFIKIYDKATAFWERLKDIGKFISNLVTRFKNLMGMDIAQMDISDPELGRFEKTFIRIYNFIEQVKTAISDAFSSISSWLGFDFKGEENGVNIVLGIFDGIIEGIKNVGGWIKAHIFDPFVEGFKSVFGIHSPAEEMKPLGENIFLGILAGIWNVVKNIGSWIKSHIFVPVKNELSAAFHNFLENTSFGKQIQKIIDGLESLKKTVKSITDSKAFQSIHDFIFGKKGENGAEDIPNIFGKIGKVINNLIKDAGYTNFHDFIFGNDKIGLDNVLIRIKNSLHDFFLGNETKGIDNFLVRTKNSLHDFILGNKTKGIDNLFIRIRTGFDGIIKNAGYTNIHDFFFGNNKIGLDNVLVRVLDIVLNKFNELKSKYPWLESIIDFLSHQIERVRNFSEKIGFSINEFLFGNEKGNVKGFNFSPFTEIIEKIKRFFISLKDLEIFKKDSKKNLFTSIADYFNGIVKTIHGIVMIPKVVHTIIPAFSAIGLLLLAIGGIGIGPLHITSPLENMVDMLTDIVKAAAIMVGLIVGLSVYIRFLDRKGWIALIAAGTAIGGIITALFILANNINGSGEESGVIESFKDAAAMYFMINFIRTVATLTAVLAGAIIALSLATRLLGPKAVIVAGIIIALAIASIGFMIKMMNDSFKNMKESTGKIKTHTGELFGIAAILFGLTTLISKIATAFTVIYFLTKGKKWEEMRMPVYLMIGALVAVMSMLLIAVSSIKKFSTLKFSGKALGTIFLLTLFISAIGSLAVALTIFGDWKEIISSLGGISLVLWSMAGVMKVLSGIQNIDLKVVFSALGIVTALGLLVVGLLWLMRIADVKADFKQIFSLMVSIVELAVAFGAVAIVIGAIGTFSKSLKDFDLSSTFIFLGKVTIIVLAIVAAIILIAGAIAKIKGAEEFIEGAGNILEAISVAIGKMIGGIIGGIGEGITDSMPKIAENMSSFMEKLQPFLDGIKDLKRNHSRGIEILVNLMLGITKTELLTAINRLIEWGFGGNNLDTAFTLLSRAADGLVEFSSKVKDINYKDIKHAADIIPALLNIASDERYKTGGKFEAISNFLTGNVDLGALFTKLNNGAAEGLREFESKVKGLSYNDITSAADIIPALLNIASDERYKTGGKFEAISNFITGNVDLGALFTKLNDGAAEGLREFESKVKGLSYDDLASAADVIPALLNIASDERYKTGGKFEAISNFLTGNVDLGALFTKLNDGTAEGLVEFEKKVKGLSYDDLASAADVIPALLNIATNNNYKTGGEFNAISNFLTGNVDLGALFTKLNNGAAEGIVEFEKKVKGLSYDDAAAAAEIIPALLNIVIDSNYKSGGIAGILDTFINGNIKFDELFDKLNGEVVEGFVEFCESIEDISLRQVSKAVEILPKIFDMLSDERYKTGGVGGWISEFISGKADFTEMFNMLLGDGTTDNPGIIKGLSDLSEELSKDIFNGETFALIEKTITTLQSLFNLMSFDTSGLISNNDSYGYEYDYRSSLQRVLDTFSAINSDIIPEITTLQENLKGNKIDANYLAPITSGIAEFLSILHDLSNFDVSTIDIAGIGQYVVDALVLALTDAGNMSDVKTAAIDLGLQIKDGLMFALDIHSPSKVAFEIGKFVAAGLTQGLRAGEGMTWSMAQGFGEGTIAALENGLRDFDAVSQHAINMVTADLVNENRFNMPNLDIKDRLGNDTYDFELMRKFLIEKFGSVMDQNVINAFVNSYEQTMKEINNTINDKDYALMMTGIAAGDFGLSEQTIIDKLTEELGSTKAAKQAWEDYNAVKEGTLKINQKLLKEQKENPPMTLEQYMKMLADEEEGYQRALRGEFDKLARENGTSRAQEIENAGYDPILIQRRLNGHMNQEAVEAYIKQKALNEEFEESTRLVDNIIERNIDAQNSVNSIDEVTESVDELNEALSFGPEDILGEKIAIKKARADADALNDVSEAAENVAEAQQQVAETADTKTKALETETKAVQTLTNAERESLSSTRENNDYYKSLNKQVLDSAVETLRKGEKLTESETKMIMNAYNAVHEGAFGVGTAFREKAFTDYGLAEDNAKYLAKLVRYYNPASQSLKQYAKWESYAKDSNSELAKSNEETAESVKNVSTALENAPEFVQKFVKTVTPQIQKAITEGKDSFEIKASDFINFAGDEFDPTELLNYFKRNDLSELTDSDVLKWDIKGLFKDVLGAGFKDMSKEDIKQLLSLDVLGDALAASMGDIFGNGKEITTESFFGGVFDLFTNADKSLTSGFLTSLGSLWRTYKGINEEAEKINETKIAPDVDNSKVQEAISMADTLKAKYTLTDNEKDFATIGLKNLQNGIKLNEKQAEAVQKVWDGAMIGLYESGEERLKQFRQLFNLGEDFTWDVLSRNIDQNGNFDISKQTSSALYYGKQVRDMIEAGEAYTNADLMKDINDLKWGVGKDRIDALTEAGYDAKKVQEEFLKWYNGDKSVENLGDDYLRISEAEAAAAEQAERMNAVLNQTPQGAFRSIADFLEGVSKVLEKKETADDFKSFITDIVESMKSLKIDNASDFERVASFLNSVRSSASGSHTIAEDFKEFVTGIKDSVKQLGEIDIQNTDGMDKVKEFLNGITIENKDTLDAVADFIRDIIDFSAGATEGSDYSSKLVESITLIQRAVNGLEIHEEATTPLVNFLHELTGSTEKLSTDSGKAIEQYINDFYAALEDPSQASAAATKIAQTLIEELQKYNTKFFDVGVDFVIMLAAGIIAGRQYVIEAAETIAGSILNTISEQATAKASEEGSKFIDNLITGMKSEDSQAKLKEALDSLFGPSEEQMDFSGQQETQPGSTPVGENLESTPGQKFAQQFITDLAEGIANGTESVQKAVESISNIISSGISIDVAGISTKAAEYVANLAAGLQAGFEENQDLLLEIVGAIASVISSAVPDGFSVGWNYIQGVYLGLLAAADYFGLGEFLPEGLNQGLMSGVDDAYNAGIKNAESAEKGFRDSSKTNSPSKVWMELGRYLVDGLVIGLDDNKDAYQAAYNLAEDTNKAAADAFDIHSPSRLWYGYGKYLIAGLALGIQESANGSVKAVSDTCNKLSEVVNTVATDVNKKRLAFDIDTSGVHEAVSSVEELWKMYTLTDVEQVLAEAGFKNLQKGARITEQQAYVLQKVWDGAMIGLYDSGEKRLGIMKKLFNSEDFTWDTFRSMYENTYIDKGMRDLYTLKDAERAAAEAGIKNLQNGVKLTEEQADAVQKVWDGAMIGLYKSGDERIAQMQQMFNLDENFAWKDFAKYFNKDTHFNLADQIEKTKPAADSANTALQDLQNVVSTIFNFGQSSEEGTKLGETLLSQIVDVIQNNAGDAVDSMKYLTDLMNLAISSAVDSASQMAEEDMNTEPVITPVVDMSNVHEAASEIDAELNKNAAIDISTGERNKANADNPGKGDGSITQIFNQNIESPKPLSRLEIYRQTKNLFGMAKSINMVQ